jgi:hypothetical protein
VNWLRVLSIPPVMSALGITMLPALTAMVRGEVLVPIAISVTVLMAAYSWARWMSERKP